MPRLSLGYMSRVPIAHHEWHRPRLSRHAFLEIVPEGMSFRVFGVHLSAVFAAWTERRRAVELRSLLNSIKRHQEGFHALVGDFNTVARGSCSTSKRCRRKSGRPWAERRTDQVAHRADVLDSATATPFASCTRGSRPYAADRDTAVRLDYLSCRRRIFAA